MRNRDETEAPRKLVTVNSDDVTFTLEALPERVLVAEVVAVSTLLSLALGGKVSGRYSATKTPPAKPRIAVAEHEIDLIKSFLTAQ